MAVSPLATEACPAYQGNYSGPEARTNITDITVHHMAGIHSAKDCGAIFQTPGRRGSSHYGIGVNGEIAWYVDENCVAWTNGGKGCSADAWPSNQRSVTIECSNDEIGGDWHVSDATLNSAIRLVADIAKRNGLGRLVVGKNLTMHKQFTPTACPGPYLESKFQYIADEANKINGGVAPAPTPTPAPAPAPAPAPSGIKVGDKVTLKSWVDYNGTRLAKTRDYYYVSQINGDRAVLRADSVNGTVYCAAKVSNLSKVGGSTPAPAPAPTPIGVGSRVTLTKWVSYDGIRLMKTRDYYYVSQLVGNRAVLRADSMNGPIYAAVNVNNLRKV